jgi:hypothetical protein
MNHWGRSFHGRCPWSTDTDLCVSPVYKYSKAHMSIFLLVKISDDHIARFLFPVSVHNCHSPTLPHNISSWLEKKLTRLHCFDVKTIEFWLFCAIVVVIKWFWFWWFFKKIMASRFCFFNGTPIQSGLFGHIRWWGRAKQVKWREGPMMQGNKYQQKCSKCIRISYHSINEFRWSHGQFFPWMLPLCWSERSACTSGWHCTRWIGKHSGHYFGPSEVRALPVCRCRRTLWQTKWPLNSLFFSPLFSSSSFLSALLLFCQKGLS